MARPTDGMAPRSRDDDDAQQYLALLRDGTRAEKILARNSLAQIFERRGMLNEAAELYESNIQLGVQDPIVYERLADVYRRRGRADLADELANAQSGLLLILAPPAEPPSTTSSLGRAGLLVLGIVSIAGVAVVAALAFAFSLRTETLLALLGILLALLTYAGITLRGRAGRAGGSSPRDRHALDRWRRAYYCERQQVVFVEGESLAVPLPKIAELLAR